MAQKTNLNVSPYFDDFESDKNYYKVLFNPGRPVQARELNTIQSILQDQIESFGSHIFKEGSVVVPGNLVYDSQFNAVKLNSTTFNISISDYIEKFVGKKISGQASGVTAIVQKVVFPDNNEIEHITLYVKYLDSNDDFTSSSFLDGESLTCTENVTYGNTTINSGTTFASLISSNATSIGSAASIGDGVYFVRGTFVNISKETIILDYYTNTPSYRVGLKVTEEIITAKDDSSLYDNAKGFTNYAAPGADRFKISLSLTKKLLTDYDTDTNFIELLRVRFGTVQKLETKTDYNIIKDYLAQRTYDESGNYSVNPFSVNINDCLNDNIGNNGLYFSNEKTDQGNIPSDNLMCVKVSPGKAYVRGYDVEKTGTTIIDVEKPRSFQSVPSENIPFEMGNLIRVNNVSGCPIQKNSISFYNRRKNNDNTISGEQIGDARVYTFNLTDAAYRNNGTNWDLYLFDIQTYVNITLNNTLTSSQLPQTSYVKGKSSGAFGYAVSAGNNTSQISLRQVSGSFFVGEQIIINGSESVTRTISSIKNYTPRDIKSVYQTGLSTAFAADTVLEADYSYGFGPFDEITVSTTGQVTSARKLFTGISTDSVISYTRPGFATETFNRVSSVSPDGLSMTVVGISTISNVCDGGLPTSEVTSRFSIISPRIRNQEKSYLYSRIPNSNIKSVNFSNSNLVFSAQTNTTPTITGNTLTLSPANFDLPSGMTTAVFQAYDEERYSIHYSDGTIETLSPDEVRVSSNQVTFFGVSNKQVSVVNATLVKPGVQSKVKTYERSKIISVPYSKYETSGTGISTSINDGLDHNKYYGLRVQDEEISLNYPDVVKIIAIYESLNTSDPTFDQLTFSSSVDVASNAIVGENITGTTSKSVARIVRKPTGSSNNLEIVYLNSNKFLDNEVVSFSESNISTNIRGITPGSYKNITNSFRLDKGQREEYYDYSRLIRNKGETEPSRRILVVFDYYSVPQDDNGDVFTVLSYTEDRFTKDIPRIGFSRTRASDTLDFRPRVLPFTENTSSPFDFSSRSFGSSPKVMIKPNEGFIMGYDYYLGRTDKLYLDKFGGFILEKGVSSVNPRDPVKIDDLMEIATIYLPPYLYNPRDAQIELSDNRRYTMRDIGSIENRVENLERITSLSLLELNTQTLQIQDADGFNRFKTGFFVDDFKDSNLINLSASLCEVNPTNNQLTPLISRNSIKNLLAPSSQTSLSTLDLSTNYPLLDPRVQKTGVVVTLKYNSVDWIEQPFATRVENVNPFHVVEYVGQVALNPSRDTWIRTVQLPSRVLAHNNTLNLESRITTERVTTNNIDNTGSTGTSLTPNSNGSRTLSVTDTFTTLSDRVINTFDEVFTSTSSSTAETTETAFVSESFDTFMRSRNTEFSVTNLKPFTRFYQFFDGNSAVDFVPKLVEISNDLDLNNYGASAAFIVGETVFGFFNLQNIITFRVAAPNHKFGSFSDPSTVYDVNPYFRDESLPEAYSPSSKVLNIDTFSLAEEAQGRFSGYLQVGTVLIGQTSGAIAYVKDLRLVSDNYGDLIGTFFIRDPNTTPPPNVRIETGNKTFKITSSQTNESPTLGSSDISSAQSNYLSEGTVQLYQEIVRRVSVNANLTTTNTVRTRQISATRQSSTSQVNLPPEQINNITNITQNITSVTNVTNIIQQQAERLDPLAQTFVVGGNVDAPSVGNFTEDSNGAFLTAVDLYFAKKSSGNSPVTVQIRTVELGTPTLTIIGNPVTLRPDQVNISTDASVATRFTFDYPIFLPPNLEYAVVILAPESIEYEVWIGQMGEKTVSTAILPDSESVVYSKQFAIGSLFKSQNGSIWSSNQFQDLKFKLYKAQFVNSSGVAFFYNPVLERSNGYERRLINNPITTYPRRLTVGVTTITNSALINILTPGRKISEDLKSYNYGYIVGTGSSVSSLGITTGGRNYVTDSLVSTYNIVGNGSGLTLNITATSGSITSVSVVNPGNGYAVGDIIGIVTSTVSSNTGENAMIAITGNNSSIDTLYLTNVQGNSFTDGARLTYYNNSGSVVSLATTYFRGNSVSYGDIYTGNIIKVDHFGHGMYAANNKLKISNVSSNVRPVSLAAPLSITDSLINVSVADTTDFGTFEGIPVSSLNPGYLKINNEIIRYESVGAGSITNITRGQDSTIAINHPASSLIYKYEVNNISLRRINTTHDIRDSNIDIDSYYVELDIDSSPNGPDRSSDGSVDGFSSNAPRLGFDLESSVGGSESYATENIQYDTVVPFYEVISPGASTNVSAQIRTVSGTSVNGNETSFVDLGYEDVQIGRENKLSSVRIVCSEVNELQYLDSIPQNKSFTTAVTLSTNNFNLSPMIFLDSTFTEFAVARLNNPINDFISDNRVNSILSDPHAAVYISNTVRLSQPSSSLRVILSAYRHSTSNFRVMYSLIQPDKPDNDQVFEFFPGYDNLTTDNNLDGYPDVVDPSKNSGFPDRYVQPSLENQFLEYQYTASGIGPFTGYTIKIIMYGTNQAYYPRFRDLRSIALA